ncbi:hypothetical protein M1446_02920 [Candidatus Dependentiae bacterium]|nr:hypothetical protein [Candidatus Dependentiae bacterium]
MYFKLRILSVLALLSLNCFAMESLDSSDEIALFQELGKEAQIELGIPEDKHAPIMALPKPISFMDKLKGQPYAAYYPTDHKILVNTICFNKDIFYGIKRGLIFHEAVHAKYKDTQTCAAVERRADIEACIAMKCFQCLEEFSLTHNTFYDFKGYISRSEIKQIAEKFKNRNCICSYHQNNPSLPSSPSFLYKFVDFLKDVF